MIVCIAAVLKLRKQFIFLKKNKELQEKKFSWYNFHVIFSLEPYIRNIL